MHSPRKLRNDKNDAPTFPTWQRGTRASPVNSVAKGGRKGKAVER